MLAGYQTKSFSTGSDSNAFLCCLLFSCFFFFLVCCLLIAFSPFPPFFFVHIGIGRILMEWVYWAGAELFMTIPPLCRLLCTFQLLFSRSYLVHYFR